MSQVGRGVTAALGIALAVTLVTLRADAQSSEARTFGTATEAVLTLSAWNFTPAAATQTWAQTPTGDRSCVSGNCQFIAGVSVPAGAIVTRVQLDACDDSATNDVAVFMGRGVSPGVSFEIFPVPAVGTGFAETPGCVLRDVEITDLTVSNATEYLNVYVNLYGTGNLTRFAAVRLFYRLQVSPAPAVASFGDVPTSHPFFQFVEALVTSGITAGCGGGNYCVNSPITRGEMAVFLSKALGLHFAP
jgi:hypothetical protein